MTFAQNLDLPLSSCEQDCVSPVLQSLGDTHNTLALYIIRSCTKGWLTGGSVGGDDPGSGTGYLNSEVTRQAWRRPPAVDFLE